jgi:two-component system, OmpR family, sensor histidine kinase KdpD
MSSDAPATAVDRLLARLQDQEHARLRAYVGAAPGVGKTYLMLRDAQQLKARGLDVVVAFVETYGRAETDAQIGTLEVVPRRRAPYRGVEVEEMDLDAVLARRPAVGLVDELAHSNVPGSRHSKRFEDVLALLDAGIHVMTAVNIQHIETLNDAVARLTGVRVGRITPKDREALARNIALAETLGATVVRVKAEKAAGGLIAFARREGITHVVFGQSQRSRWQILLNGSVIDRFLTDVPDATVQVVPIRG